MTIESDEEVEEEVAIDEPVVEQSASKKKRKKAKRKGGKGKKGNADEDSDAEMSSSFQFGDDGASGSFAEGGWNLQGVLEKVASQDRRYDGTGDLARRIERTRQRLRKEKRARSEEGSAQGEGGSAREMDGADDTEEELAGAGEAEDDADDGENGDGDDDGGDDRSEGGDDSEAEDDDEDEDVGGGDSDRVRTVRGSDAPLASAAASAFYDSVEATESSSRPDTLFTQLNLSRPILKGIEKMGFVTPTAIQAKAIPIALAGRDICGSAVTGSGKTAAFLLPALERLLFRPRDVPATRVLVVTPTRELAAQCHAMLLSLSRFAGITASLVSGGAKNVRAQASELRGRPDVVICTPGRMIDHLQNSASVHLDDLEILVLDEADRLLELGFRDEVEELVSHAPKRRQTMLFSATFSDGVEELMRLSLKRPVRVMADAHRSVAPRLVQEFVRIRNDMEEDRMAILAALLKRSFTTRSLVFFETRRQCHDARIRLGLLGIACLELHGDVTQSARLRALQQFRDGDGCDALLCTDLAARGLDVPGLRTVINYTMPRQRQTYVHRVGRTARAGCGGRAVTLVGEGRRHLMKEIVKSSEESGLVKARAVPPGIVESFRARLGDVAPEVSRILQEEYEERKLRIAEMEAQRAVNLVAHRDEIDARPAREWFQSNAQKKEAAERARRSALGLPDADAAGGAGGGGAAAAAPAVQPMPEVRMKDAGKKMPHRMTRKKRRRMEADRDMERATKEEERRVAAAEENGRSVNPRKRKAGIATQGDQQASARRVRKEAQSKKAKAEERTVAELAKRPAAHAWGDGGDAPTGFEEDLGKGGKKKKRSEQGAEEGGDQDGAGSGNRYGFTDFDPNKFLRRGGKLSNKSFKSKKRYKRR